MAEFTSKIRTIEWIDNYSKMVDQTKFPDKFEYVKITNGQDMFDAIKTMIVRGAPAIGIAGAHGVVLFAQELAGQNLSRDEFISKLLEKADYMASARPTAVNLMWAVEKQKEIIRNSKSDIATLIEELKVNGKKLEEEDIAINKRIGDYGAEVVPKVQRFSLTVMRELWQQSVTERPWGLCVRLLQKIIRFRFLQMRQDLVSRVRELPRWSSQWTESP